MNARDMQYPVLVFTVVTGGNFQDICSSARNVSLVCRNGDRRQGLGQARPHTPHGLFPQCPSLQTYMIVLSGVPHRQSDGQPGHARMLRMRITLGPHLEPEDITMNVLLSELKQPRGTRWQVSMDQHVVSFRSEAEARAFIATLEARLQAPHGLPQVRQASTG